MRRAAHLIPSRWTISAFVGPALLLYSLVFLVPIAIALSNSLFSWEGIARSGFVWFDNFARLFVLQPYAAQFGNALMNNLVFLVGAMVLQNGIGLLLAFALNRTLPGKRLFQTLISAPYLMSALVIGYAWAMILSAHFGALNAILDIFGIAPVAWLGTPSLAMPILIVVNAWQWAGVAMLIFGAGLATIDHQIVEAARIDGASTVRIGWSIELPLLMPSISVVTLLTVIGAINVFDLVYAFGGSSGGIGGAADVIGTLFYRVSFGNDLNANGLSGALSVLQLALTLLLAILTQRSLSRIQRRFAA